MRIDNRENEVSLHSAKTMAKTQAIAAQTIDRANPPSEQIRELAAQGALISPAMEAKLQSLAHGQTHKKRTLGDEMRELLGISANQTSEVGVRKHGDMDQTSASRYATLVSSLKELLLEDQEARVMTDFDQDEDELMDVDEEMGSTVRTSEMQSELMFLREQVQKLQKEAGRRQENEGVRKNRFGIGA